MHRLRLVLDTNVVIDFMNEREPFYRDARLLLIGGKVGEFDLWVSSSQMTDLLYITSDGERASLLPEAMRKLRGLCSFVGIIDIGLAEIASMLNTSWTNPEDALVHEAALKIRADAIITRDSLFRKQSELPAMDCATFFNRLRVEQGLTYDYVRL